MVAFLAVRRWRDESNYKSQNEHFIHPRLTSSVLNNVQDIYIAYIKFLE